MLLASYVDDDVGWVVPLWREDDPASSLSTSAKMTQNRNYCNSSVQTRENLGFLLKPPFKFLLVEKLPPQWDIKDLSSQTTDDWFDKIKKQHTIG